MLKRGFFIFLLLPIQHLAVPLRVTHHSEMSSSLNPVRGSASRGPLAVASLREELPENFQKAESLLEHGFLDAIVHRTDMRQRLTDLIAFAV